MLLLVTAVVVTVGGLAVAGGWLNIPSRTVDESVTGSGDRTLDTSESRNTPGAAQSAESSGRVYGQAPDFEREAMDGSILRLSSFRGQVVVLNFWATWCTPCRVEIPEFIAMQRELDGVEFIGISLDEEGFDAVRPYAEEMGINYSLVIGDDSLVADFGGIEGLPTSYVLDRNGQIRQRLVGMVNTETLKPILERLLEET